MGQLTVDADPLSKDTMDDHQENGRGLAKVIDLVNNSYSAIAI